MKFYIALASLLLILGYSVIVGVFYKDRFETDLSSRAESFFSTTHGFEQVKVEFRSFDAYLSGQVPSQAHRDSAARFITSLPAARLVSNGISYPGYNPPTAPEISANPAPSASPAPAPAPPQAQPSLTVSSENGSLTLSGAAPDITLKSSFLKAIALSGKLIDVNGGGFAIDPALAASDWPDQLPTFIAFLLTRTTAANFTIDARHVSINATALDAIALDRIQNRLDALDFGDRDRSIDLTQAPELEIADGGFFFKGVFEGNNLAMKGQFDAAETRDRLGSVLETDLPDLEVANTIEIAENLDAPDWAARLPNLLSLVCSRTRDARISADADTLVIVAEMDRDQAPEDLDDIVSLMIGPPVHIRTHLLSFEQSLIDTPPAPESPDPDPQPGSGAGN